MDTWQFESEFPAMAKPHFGSRDQTSLLIDIGRYAGSLAMIGASTLVGLWIAPRWGTGPVDLLYLPAVLTAAALWGLGPSLVGGVAAALAYNFFFTEPIHTFRIDRVADIVTVIVLLVVALVTSRLAAGIRKHAKVAAAHAERNATIAGFARQLLSQSSQEEIARTTCRQVSQLFDCNAVIANGLPQPTVVASYPEGNRLTPSDVAAAALVLETGEPAGRGALHVQPAEWLFYPIGSSDHVLAAAGAARDDGNPPISEEQALLFTNLLDQVALAMERVLAEDRDRPS